MHKWQWVLDTSLYALPLPLVDEWKLKCYKRSDWKNKYIRRIDQYQFIKQGKGWSYRDDGGTDEGLLFTPTKEDLEATDWIFAFEFEE